jgi:hypothetical protein
MSVLQPALNQVTLKGNTLAEQLTDADESAGDLTFAADIEFVDIYNRDATNDGEFVVNGITIVVPAGAAFGPVRIGGSPSAIVAVTGSASYVVSRLT